METKPSSSELIERVENFFWDSDTFKKQLAGKESLFEDLHDLCEVITSNLSKPHKIRNDLMLRMVFKEIFSFWDRNVGIIGIFDKYAHLAEDVLDAYFFYALVMFMTSTKKSDSISLRKFTYRHSKDGYNKKESKYYFDYGHPGKDGISHIHKLENDEAAFRQARYRIHKKRLIYNKRPEWSAMPKSSEHEWSFYFFLDHLTEDNPLRDTFKRMGNLYNNNLHEAGLLSSETEENYNKKLHEYKKFLKRLEKIEYEKFLELSRAILEHISNDKLHYGINMYRFEKMFRLHNITSTISLLLKSKDEKEAQHILLKDIYLNNIDFPRLYQNFNTFENFSLSKCCADIFIAFKESLAISCCLIIDALVEKKCFGDEWEALFLDTINEMAKKTYYSPDEIDYSVENKSQEYFEEIRSVLVRYNLNIPLFLK